MKYKHKITGDICEIFDKSGAGMGKLRGNTLVIYKIKNERYYRVMIYSEFYDTHDEII
jgi:hypothetical protein